MTQQAMGQQGHAHAGSAPLDLPGRKILIVWGISLLLHTIGLTIMFFRVFPFAPQDDIDAPVAQAELLTETQTASFKPSRRPDLSDETIPVDPPDVRIKPEPFEQLADLKATKKPDLSIIGIGAGGGDFSEYGLTAGTGSAPSFFGLGGTARSARRIVYVVDISGSMLGTFRHVRRELIRSISALDRSQEFHVIFFNSGTPLEMAPKKPVPAIQAQKNRFMAFLKDVFPSGSTHPEWAMRRALAQEPDVIYFLTDGEFDPKLVSKLDKWNKDRAVQIFTIAYFDRAGAQLLERIAREHGGEFKYVTEDDLP